MAGRKGQPNPSRHPRKNEYMIGLKEPTRNPEVFAFKLPVELHPIAKSEIEEKGLTKQQWCDLLVSSYYGSGGDEVGDGEGGKSLTDLDLEKLKEQALKTLKVGKQAAAYKKASQVLDVFLEELLARLKDDSFNEM